MSLGGAARRTHSAEDHWIPLSDLMSGLMMMFMLVAIVFMIQVQREAKKVEVQANKVKNIATNYSDLRKQLYQDLNSEFKNDLPVWKALLDRQLSIRFAEPSIQFDSGSSNIKPGFASVLNSFFPRYVNILDSPKYRDAIEELRIEGHTSSIWESLQPEQAYYRNMELSQDRTRAVLEYVFALPQTRPHLGWLVPRTTANGLSSSHRIAAPDGREDPIASQRVEFRVRTKAEDRLESILTELPK
jgi:outer membrane protein OmpA-like peptidoglycan-associated protein